MEVIIRPDKASAADLVSELIARELRARPTTVLGLATGATMEVVYDLLAAKHRGEGLDFSLCRSFNLDEYIGLPPEHPNSYRHYMNKHLFSKVNIDQRNTFLPHGDAADVDAECERYERCIREIGGIDLQLLGIGQNGHIGFNEPISSLGSRTRAKALTPATLAQNSIYFEPPSGMPKRAMTMGVGTILDSRRAILLATGEAKSGILAKAVEGPVTSMVSASALQLHPRCTVVVDEAAAAELSGKDYYHWIFQNEPEWADFR